MAFCANCGRQLEEGEVCGCTSGAPQKKKSKKGLVIFLCALVLVVGCGVAVFLTMANGYKKPITGLTTAVNKKETNVDNIVKAALPKFVSSSYAKAVKILKSSDSFSDIYDDASDSLENLYEDLDSQYGDGWKVKFDTTDREKMDAERLEDVEGAYESLYSRYFKGMLEEFDEYDKYDYEDVGDQLGISSSKAKDLIKVVKGLMKEFEDVKVKEGYLLKGRLVITDANGETLYKSEKMTVQVVRLNGDWTIDYLSLMSDIGPIFSNMINGLMY